MLIPIFSFAQIEKGHYMPLSLSYINQTVKDQALSPVSYSGSLGGVGLGYYYQGDKWLVQLDLGGGIGYQNPDVNRADNYSQTTTLLSRIILNGLYKVASPNDWSIYAGLVSYNLFDYRTHNRYSNSSENYQALFSFGLSLATQKSFELFSKNFSFQYTIGLPFGTSYLRPSYIKPSFNYEVGSKGMAYWGDFYLINSKPELIWHLENGNQIRLFYHYEFTNLDQLNKVQSSMYQLGISTVFKF